jgi:flavin-dependent dehydrogenase
MLAGFEPYATWFRNARLERAETGIIPVYALQRLVYDGLLMVGDAAGQATLWSCMGSEAALEAGRLAGRVAAEALRGGNVSRRMLEPYQQRWDRAYRDLYRRSAWIGPIVWAMSEGEWNRQTALVQRLTPEQMVARLRSNWPLPSYPQAVFIRLYDVAGRIRRGLMRRLLDLRRRAKA